MALPGDQGLVSVAEHMDPGCALLSLLQMVKLSCPAKGSRTRERLYRGRFRTRKAIPGEMP